MVSANASFMFYYCGNKPPISQDFEKKNDNADWDKNTTLSRLSQESDLSGLFIFIFLSFVVDRCIKEHAETLKGSHVGELHREAEKLCSISCFA